MLDKIQNFLGVNIKLRTQNIYYIISIILSIILPILAANNMELSDLTSWDTLGETLKTVITSPYVLLTEIIAIVSATVNFDSKGLKDNDITFNKLNIKEDILQEKELEIQEMQKRMLQEKDLEIQKIQDEALLEKETLEQLYSKELLEKDLEIEKLQEKINELVKQTQQSSITQKIINFLKELEG